MGVFSFVDSVREVSFGGYPFIDVRFSREGGLFTLFGSTGWIISRVIAFGFRFIFYSA